MAADQQFCLRWNNHQSTLISVFDTLLASGQLVDCTLAAEGQYLKAHKVVLSACSPYLEVLLSQHYEKHPIVILKDVKFQELKSMMDYMYRGEVNISQDQLGTFLKAAESLQIKGLSDSGGENDSRDVGSTNKRQEGPPPPATRKASVPSSQPRSPAVIPQSSSGLTIEPRRSMQPHVDIPPSSPLRSREGSVSPTPRKRRRQRRPSQGDDNQLSSDSHIDTSNSCDLPSQAQSTPVPTIPATMTPVVPSSAPSTISKPIDSEQPPLETDRLGTSINSNVSIESTLIKEKLEPTSEILLEPKTEYLEDVNNEDSVEDLTLDDDDDMDASGNMDMARPGPSHVDSNQSFTPWQHMQSGDRSATDEVFMAAQEAVGAHRDSQGRQNIVSDDSNDMGKLFNAVNKFGSSLSINENDELSFLLDSDTPALMEKQIKETYSNFDNLSFVGDKEKKTWQREKEKRRVFIGPGSFPCPGCGKVYRWRRTLLNHRNFECGKEPQFKCPFCNLKSKRKSNIFAHVRNVHKTSLVF